MLWNLEHAEHIEFYKIIRKRGLKTPLGTKPKGTLESEWYLSQFYMLSKSRSSNGFGLNPIPLTEIISLFTLVTKPIFDLVTSIRIIQEIDTSYVNFLNEKHKSKTKTQ